jgi:signal transduction histidine kinase
MAELRTLSDYTAELFTKDISTDHIASRAARMLALTSALAEVDTISEVVDVVLDLGLGVVDGICGLIARVEHGALLGIRATGYDTLTEVGIPSTAPNESSPLGASVLSRKPLYIASAQEYRARFPMDYRVMGVATRAQAHVALPLIHRDVLIGGLSLGFGSAGAYASADRALLSFLAGTTACALARAIERDADRASKRDCELLARTRVELLGVVAHDLRNPLNLIQITAEMLRDAELPPTMRDDMLERCIRATRQMNRLIEDLLDATSIRGGGLRLECALVDLKELMAQVNETYRPLAQEHRVFLEVSAPTAPVSARVDASRVLQAVGNLIGNALKFTPRGGRVAVEASVTAHDVVIAVSDTGPGIAAEAVGRVFEAFWQANADRRGIGLGLAIAKGIAEAHGGRIDVDSTQGQGSTFRFILPLASRDASSVNIQ